MGLRPSAHPDQGYQHRSTDQRVNLLPLPFLRKENVLFLRGTLTLPAKGLRPSAHPDEGYKHRSADQDVPSPVRHGVHSTGAPDQDMPSPARHSVRSTRVTIGVVRFGACK